MPADLSELLAQREAVRVLLMRRTLHLVSARDCLGLRRLHDPMLVARMRGTLGRRLPGVDEEALAVRRSHAARWAGGGTVARGRTSATPSSVRVQGQRAGTAPARNTTIDAWLGAEPVESTPETGEALVLRYLAAYGRRRPPTSAPGRG